MLKMQHEKSEAMKDYYFLSPIRKEALQTFRNMNASNKGTLEVVLLFFQRKYVRPLSEARQSKLQILLLSLTRNHSQTSLKN